jgi:hypothetical protein
MKAIIVLAGPQESSDHDIKDMHYVLSSRQLYNRIPMGYIAQVNHWRYPQVLYIHKDFLTETIPYFFELTGMDMVNKPVYGAIKLRDDGGYTMINSSLNSKLDRAITYIHELKGEGNSAHLIKFTSYQLRTFRLPN